MDLNSRDKVRNCSKTIILLIKSLPNPVKYIHKISERRSALFIHRFIKNTPRRVGGFDCRQCLKFDAFDQASTFCHDTLLPALFPGTLFFASSQRELRSYFTRKSGVWDEGQFPARCLLGRRCLPVGYICHSSQACLVSKNYERIYLFVSLLFWLLETFATETLNSEVKTY